LTLTDAKAYQAPLRPPVVQICVVQLTLKFSKTLAAALLQLLAPPELPLAPELLLPELALLPELLVLLPELAELPLEPLALPELLVLVPELLDALLVLPLVPEEPPTPLVAPEDTPPVELEMTPLSLDDRFTQTLDTQLREALHVSFE
jgi:hypothetical protein